MLKLSSLGSVDATGERNCLSIEDEKGQTILLDFGIKVPDNNVFQAKNEFLPEDLYPDLVRVEELERRGLLSAIVASHGHLDHVGAFDRLLLDMGISPLTICSGFTANVIDRKILKNPEDPNCLVNAYTRNKVQAGPFEVEQFDVLHSIPGAKGFLIKSGGVTVVYGGDLKSGVCPDQPAHIRKGYARYMEILRQIGERERVDYLILDGTNIPEEGYAGVEESVLDELESIIDENPNGKVFIAMISSNIAREEGIIRIGHSRKRPVFVAGAAIKEMLRIAGVRGWHPLSKNSALGVPGNAIIIATGSQGERSSFFQKIASGNLDFDLEISKRDVAVVSSDTIPVPEVEENFSETASGLSLVFDKLYLTHDTPEFENCGAEIVRSENLHRSGHCKQGDDRKIIEAVKPRVIIPYHADTKRKLMMADFVKQEYGLPSLILEEGGHLSLTK